MNILLKKSNLSSYTLKGNDQSNFTPLTTASIFTEVPNAVFITFNGRQCCLEFPSDSIKLMLL